MKEACDFQENNWQYLRPIIKLKLSNQSLDSCLILKELSDETDDDANKGGVLIFYSEMCKDWRCA